MRRTSTLARHAAIAAASACALGCAVPVALARTASPGSCETLSADFGRSLPILKLLRAFRGPDGNSKIEETALPGKIGSYYGGHVTLTQFDLGDPTKVAIVFGHPNIDIPVHPSPYREIFLILSGSSTVRLADGTEYRLTPGSMLLSEDQDTPGRAGKAGPCGYVAIDLQFAPPKS